MNSARDTPKSCPLRVGFPIRRSRDQRSLASPPGFSQRAASFIASQCQGIHQMPFIRARCAGTRGRTRDDPKITRPAPRPPENRRAQGPAPPSSRRTDNPARGPRMKTLLSDDARHQAHAPKDNSPCPRPVRLGHIHKSASPFNQRQPRNPPDDPQNMRRGTFPARPTNPGTKPVFSECRPQDPVSDLGI